MTRIAITLIAAVTLTVTPLRAQNMSAITGLYDLVDALSKLAEWADWVGRATVAIDNKTPVPAPPVEWTGKDKIVSFLEKHLQSAKDITIPVAATPIPAVPSAIAGSPDAVRSSFQPSIAQLALAMNELEEIQAFRQGLEDLRLQARQAGSILAQVGQTLLDIAANVPNVKIQETFLFVFVDIELSFRPALDSIEEVVVKKGALASTAVTARASVLMTSATGLRDRLVEEGTALKAEADRLAKSAASLRARQEALDNRRADLDHESSVLADIEDRIESQRAEIDEIEQNISAWLQEQNAARTAKQNHIVAMRANYNRCPAGTTVSYASCTHTDLKNNWDQEVANSAVAKARDAEVASLQRSINEGRIRQQALRANNASLQSNLAARRKTLAAHESQWKVDAAQWRQDVIVDLADRWRSRADVHWSANQNDAAQVRSAIARLPALGAKP